MDPWVYFLFVKRLQVCTDNFGYKLGRSEDVELLSLHPRQTFPRCGAYSKANLISKEWRKN